MRLVKSIEELKSANLYIDNKYIFSEVLELCANEDLEFMGEQYLIDEDVEYSDKIDALHTLYFKSFNKQLDIAVLDKKVSRLNDSEFAYYQAVQVGDLILVIASI